MPLPDNAWELVFNPVYTDKLKSCGIAYLDSPTEVIPPAMHYLGKNAYSNDPADHKAAGEMLAKVRPHIRMFSSSMIDDLAGGKACVALGRRHQHCPCARYREQEWQRGAGAAAPNRRPDLL
jgi:putrescine transport system substrate-binding protein